jgi:hypothetical protein
MFLLYQNLIQWRSRAANEVVLDNANGIKLQRIEWSGPKHGNDDLAGRLISLREFHSFDNGGFQRGRECGLNKWAFERRIVRWHVGQDGLFKLVQHA